MQSALSIRYGGLLVDANECDYTSFKHLGLICPNCKKSVFVVAESGREAHSRKLKDGRTTSVKECKVPQHFAHHPDVSASQVEACELRIKKMTRVEKTAVRNAARNQMLRVLHSHFWKILKTSLYLNSTTADLVFNDGPSTCDQKTEIIKDLFISASIKQPRAAERDYEVLVECLLKDFRNDKNFRSKDFSDVWSEVCENGLYLFSKHIERFEDEFDRPASMEDLEDIGPTKLELAMHEKIVFECFEFLCQLRQFPILKTLIEVSLYYAVSAQMTRLHQGEQDLLATIDGYYCPGAVGSWELKQYNEYNYKDFVAAARSLIGLNRAEYQDLFICVALGVMRILAATDWAGEFERLHNQELMKAS